LDTPKISCGLKTNVPGNYTLTIVRPDQVNFGVSKSMLKIAHILRHLQSTEILLVTVEPSKTGTEGSNLTAFFRVNVVNLRPCEIHVRLLQGAKDVDGLFLGTVQITPRAVPRTKREEVSRQAIRKMSKMAQNKKKNKNKQNKNKKDKTDDKLEVHEFTSGSEPLRENAPFRQAPSKDKKPNKKSVAKKKKKSKDSRTEKPKNNWETLKKNDRHQKRKNKENKQHRKNADNLRQKNALKASEEAFENPIQIDFMKHRKPKSIYPTRVAENSPVEVQREAAETRNIGEQ
jgi:hypothetical protein